MYRATGLTVHKSIHTYCSVSDMCESVMISSSSIVSVC